MKKINLYITIVLITAIFHSCNEGQVPDVPGDNEITIKVSSLGDSDTKASYFYEDVIAKTGYMTWDNGDKIGLFESVPIAITGIAIVPITGPNQNAQFNIASGAGGSRSARFYGEMTDPGNAKFSAYYPYNPDAEMVCLDGGSYGIGYNVYAPFPYNQTYLADSFTNVPAVALFDSANNGGELHEGVFTFRNICNVLRFRVQLPSGSLESHTLSRIEVSYEYTYTYDYGAPSGFTILFTESDWLLDDFLDQYDPRMQVVYNNIAHGYNDNFDQPCISYEIPGGHSLSDTPGYYYHIALPPPSSYDMTGMGNIRFVMSDGKVHNVRVALGLLLGINMIYTVPDLTLDNITNELFNGQLKDPIDAPPISGFWIPTN